MVARVVADVIQIHANMTPPTEVVAKQRSVTDPSTSAIQCVAHPGREEGIRPARHVRLTAVATVTTVHVRPTAVGTDIPTATTQSTATTVTTTTAATAPHRTSARVCSPHVLEHGVRQLCPAVVASLTRETALRRAQLPPGRDRCGSSLQQRRSLRLCRRDGLSIAPPDAGHAGLAEA